MPTIIKLNYSKIPKERLFQGKSGELIDLVLLPDYKGKDKYGNDGAVVVSQTKEEREAKAPRIYVGNYREIGGAAKHAPQQQARQQSDPDLDSDGSPFRR